MLVLYNCITERMSHFQGKQLFHILKAKYEKKKKRKKKKKSVIKYKKPSLIDRCNQVMLKSSQLIHFCSISPTA